MYKLLINRISIGLPFGAGRDCRPFVSASKVKKNQKEFLFLKKND